MDNIKFGDVPQSELLLILERLSGIYVSVYLIDLVSDTAKEVTTKDTVNRYIKEGDSASNMMRTVIENTVIHKHRKKALEFNDLTTVSERLKGKKTIFDEFIGENFGWIRQRFISIEEDLEGNPARVLHTVEVIDDQKRKEEYLRHIATTDELTDLYNRKAYDEAFKKYSDGAKRDSLVYISVDVNGLKQINDTYGHDAGDELICGAAECLRGCLSDYGKVYRMGGDEFIAILFADENMLNNLRETLDFKVYKWKGTLVDELSISCGCVRWAEFPDKDLKEIVKIADDRMYIEKDMYYKTKGVDRKGVKTAYEYISNSILKILRVNLTNDSFDIIKVDENELKANKGYQGKLSNWLYGFAVYDQVHKEDVDRYVKNTNLDFLKKHFDEGNKFFNFHYRRRVGDEYRYVIMELVPTNEYSIDNQECFLYVKNSW